MNESKMGDLDEAEKKVRKEVQKREPKPEENETAFRKGIDTARDGFHRDSPVD